MKLVNFVNEIFDIAHENDVDIGVGKDMFLTNITNVHEGSDIFYHGADDVDYEALYPYVDDLWKQSNEYHDAVRENLQEIARLRKEGKRDEVLKLLGV